MVEIYEIRDYSRLKSGTVIDKDFGAICVLKTFICGIFDKRGVGKSLESR